MLKEIGEKEKNSGGWSLMHRFWLCRDLLKEESMYKEGNLAFLVILLRFSSLRLLTW